jgi:alpha-ketoglutarate-dependent taurine dioxygenase
MSDTHKPTSWAERQSSKLQPTRVSRTELVRAESLYPDTLLPLVIEPALAGLNPIAWAANHRNFLETCLYKHGAILFRNFGLRTAADFERFTHAVSGELIEYRERSSPRHEMGNNIYTSTDYPADQMIFPHNEHSYSQRLPLKLFFFCLTPATEGGETPLADCRNIYQRIDRRIRERFIQKMWMYVRNFGHGFGVSWETAFQTADRKAVESYCLSNRIEFMWKGENYLTTRQIRPPIARHPRTGEYVWFNHATFFHVSTLEPLMRETLLATFKEEDLPNNTYYGDGSPIEPDVLDELRQAYQEEMVSFTWRQGDLILLDNMLTAHARRPFTGPRQVLFAMSDPYTRTDF